MLRPAALVALALGLAPLAGACSSGASGVDACKSIEEARCQQAPNCPNIQLSPPLYTPSGSLTDACIRYYDTACLHGLAIGSSPSSQQLNACVAAINTGSCDIVAAPESAPDCAWLSPPDAGTDAGDDGASADATNDVDADGGG